MARVVQALKDPVLIPIPPPEEQESSLRRIRSSIDQFAARAFSEKAASIDVEVGSGRCRWYLLFTIAAYLAYNAVTQPGLVLHGDMWAEMGPNYFDAARSPSWFVKLFSTDAGYIPFPQRLLAVIVWALQLPAVAIPYCYTLAGLFCSSLMVAAFCLPAYRKLVHSDALRFSMCIVVLLMCDFQTKTFVNFTYSAAFFVAIVTALALTDRQHQVTPWSWFIPVLMLSKPAMLAALPAMIIAASVSLGRFRAVTAVSVFFAIGQIVQLVVSRSTGDVMISLSPEPGVGIKLWNAIRYCFGFLSGYIGGPSLLGSASASYPNLLVGMGGLIAVGLLTLVVIGRARGGALILVALSMAFCAMLINAFALSDTFNRAMAGLAGLPVHRHTIINLFAAIMIVGAVIGSLISLETAGTRNLASAASVGIFLGGFVLSGWYHLALSRSKQWPSPVTQNSQWTKLAAAIDGGTSPLCVPIDPIGWVWKRNCEVLNRDIPTWIHPRDYQPVEPNVAGLSIDLTVPAVVANASLQSVGILMKPLGDQLGPVRATLTLTLESGETRTFYGEDHLAPEGKLIYLSGISGAPVEGVKKAHLQVDSLVQLAVLRDDPMPEKTMLWMGAPRR